MTSLSIEEQLRGRKIVKAVFEPHECKSLEDYILEFYRVKEFLRVSPKRSDFKYKKRSVIKYKNEILFKIQKEINKVSKEKANEIKTKLYEELGVVIG